MRRAAVCLLAVLVAFSAFAVDLGRAVGSLTTGANAIPLAYAYAMDGVHNDLDNKKDAVKIILTDKPLPAGTRLADVDYTFPEDILGIVVCLDKNNQPVHVVVQHPQGTYDGGWVELDRDVRAHAKRSNGVLEGRVTCKRAEKGSVTFSFDVEFAATVQ